MRTITRAAFHESREARRQFREKTASWLAWLAYWRDIRGVPLAEMLARMSIKLYAKAFTRMMAAPVPVYWFKDKKRDAPRGRSMSWPVRSRRGTRHGF